MNLFEKTRYNYAQLSVSNKVIAWTVVISLLAWLLGYFYPVVYDKLSFPGDIRLLITQPWSLLTYGFIHGGFFHLLFNMLALSVVARFMMNIFSGKQFITLYILGIIAGAIIYLGFNSFATGIYKSSSLVGASAGVYAVLFFACFYEPTTMVRIIVWNVKLVYVAYVLLAIDIGSVIIGMNPGGSVAHLAGAGLGFYTARQMRNGIDILEPFSGIMNFFSGSLSRKRTPKKPSHLKTVYKSEKRSSPVGFSKTETQKRVDAILEKISESGYESLSKADKDFLFQVGKD